jgi:alanyl aminopeptidase
MFFSWLDARGGGLAIVLALGGCVPGNDITRAPDAVPAGDGATPVPAPLASGRLPGTAKPLHYDVALVIDPARERFTGDVTITIEVPKATSAIVLNGRDLTIVRAEASSNGQQIPATASFRAAAGNKESADELVLVLARPLAAGKADLHIAYSAPISDKLSGLYRVREDGVYYAFTQFEPTDARRMLPCFDEPSFKVPFVLRVTTPKGNVVVANSPEIEHSDVAEGKATEFRFAPTEPLPTYLFALAVGPLEFREGPKEPVPIRVVTTRGKAKLGDLAIEAATAHTKILVDYFGRPYPFAKLDLLAVPEFGFGAMENAGLITFREDRILLDPKRASSEARRALAVNIAHEVSHHWFGNLVTMPWWDDLWLNEGFATWMEGKVVDTWHPQMDARLEQMRSRAIVMGVDALDSARSVRQPVANNAEAEEAFDGITYDKGAAVLGMLETWIGETAFRDGLRSYLKAHEYGSATQADLFAALAKASGKDVSPVASTFLDQAGVPLVRAELVCEKGDKAAAPKVKLAQERYRARPTHETEHHSTWKIPICVAFEGMKAPACDLLVNPTGEIELPKGHCPRWIYPNEKESGYFRFALPPAELAALAENARTLDVRSRVGLVDNAWALVQSGDLGSDALLDLIASLRGERNRHVVEEVILTLQGVSDKLVDDAARPAFRAYVSSVLGPIAREIGFEARPHESDDVKLLRRSVLTALSTLAEDNWVASQSDRTVTVFFKDARAVDADMAAIALRASTRRASEPRFHELVELLKRAPTPEDRALATSALGSFADPALLRRALDLMLSDQVKLQDGFAIYSSAMTYPDSRRTVLAWIEEHFTELKTKMPDFALTRLSGAVERICETPARADAARFFVAALKGEGAGDRALQQALETADLCIDLRAREAARMKKKLAKKG